MGDLLKVHPMALPNSLRKASIRQSCERVRTLSSKRFFFDFMKVLGLVVPNVRVFMINNQGKTA